MDQRLLHKSIASLPVFDVVIVGAGLAGLRVAAGCEERGVSYVLLEASPTVGGRVRRAPDWFLPGIGLDLGGEAIHGSTTPLNRLAQLANVETQEFFVVSQGDGGPDEAPVNGKIGYYYYQPAGSSRKEIRRYDELDENAQRAHSMLAELAEVASLDQLDVPDAGNSLGSLMDAIGISQGVRALLDAGYANTDSANSIDELSLSRVVDFENDWAEHDGCAEASDFAIVNDDECLADLAGELLKRIDTTRLRVNAVVERVDTLSESGVVAVSCRDPRNARGMRVVARAAVVCVPLAQLKRGAIVFTPPLERVKRSAIDALRVHSGCKVTLKYLARPAPNASPPTTTTTSSSSSSPPPSSSLANFSSSSAARTISDDTILPPPWPRDCQNCVFADEPFPEAWFHTDVHSSDGAVYHVATAFATARWRDALAGEFGDDDDSMCRLFDRQLRGAFRDVRTTTGADQPLAPLAGGLVWDWTRDAPYIQCAYSGPFLDQFDERAGRDTSANHFAALAAAEPLARRFWAGEHCAYPRAPMTAHAALYSAEHVLEPLFALLQTSLSKLPSPDTASSSSTISPNL